jgi:cellulose synthase/poly-beta-1,6-N-acetylglucosamine synthase-like glycosyltransferase
MYKQWKMDTVPAPLRAQVTRYRSWLLDQEKRASNVAERTAFAADASALVRGRGHVFQPYSPYREKSSALTVVTLSQQVILVLGGCLLAASLLQWHLQALSVILGVLTFGYLFQLCLSVVACLRVSGENRVPVDQQLLPYLDGCPWPDYTILCPLYQEGPVVSQFLRAMLQLDYPTEHLQILLLTEERDPATRAEIVAMGTLPAHVTLVTVPGGGPRTKPRACNYGLTLATGQYCVIYDGEDIVDPLQLKKAVLTFATHGPDLACVQARLNFYNTYQNLLTRFFTIEYTLWFDLMLPALQKMKLALPLGGTSNHFVTSVLRGLGGWDAFNVTEDADLGMRLSQHHFTTAMLESTTYEEANADLGNWVRQRSRWIKGYLQTYLVHTRSPFSALSKGRGKTLFSLLALVGGGSLTFFFNPLMWLMLIVYIVFRAHVEGVYHALFPAPVLYAGVLCLIFGNFFYLYSAMVACVRRKQYGLVPWCLLLPVYWLLMSVAACKGLYQLATRPHYWEKTRHGLHLKDRKATANVIAISQEMVQAAASAPTEQALAVTTGKPLLSLTEAVKAISTLPMAAVDKTYREAVTKRSETKTRNLPLILVFSLTTIFSLLSCFYYYQEGAIPVYGDSHSHLRIARAVFDSTSPGVAQLGTVWLPLPHILMWPFIWNDFLWHSGLAGAFPAMLCYIGSGGLLYLILKKMSGSILTSVVGWFLFASNPNILYLQTTPLSELVCIFTFLCSAYLFILWDEHSQLLYLVLLSISIFFMTLARYDGWANMMVLSLLVPALLFLQKKSRKEIMSLCTVFYSIAALGVFLWLCWNKVLFGSFFYFKTSLYSAQAQQKTILDAGNLYTYHNLYESVRYYSIDLFNYMGTVFTILSLVSLAMLLFIYRKQRRISLLFLLVTPFVFYVVSLYSGQAVLQLPGADPATFPLELFNTRYGIQCLASCVIVSVLCVHMVFRKKRILLMVILLAGSLFQTVSLYRMGTVSVEEGYLEVCAQSAVVNTANEREELNKYLSVHYRGGKILQDDFTAGGFDVTEVGLDFKNIIYQGSYGLWNRALVSPWNYASWVVVTVDKKDAVYMSTGYRNPAFKKHYSLTYSSPGGSFLLYRLHVYPDQTQFTASSQFQKFLPYCATEIAQMKKQFKK